METLVTTTLAQPSTSTPVTKPNVTRKPKAVKQKSMSDAIAMLADAHQNSDRLFAQLEEKRMKLEADSEERRHNRTLEFEMRKTQAQGF